MPYKNLEDRQTHTKLYYQKNKDKILTYSKDNAFKYKEKRNRRQKEIKFEAPEKYILGRIKRSAKKRDLDFNLTVEDIIIPHPCPILEIPIQLNLETPKDNSISVDRLDSSKGYIKGNIRIISHKANAYKNNMKIETIERLLAYMKGEI